MKKRIVPIVIMRYCTDCGIGSEESYNGKCKNCHYKDIYKKQREKMGAQ